jgi:NADH-quinone oxidoreductase subunit A
MISGYVPILILLLLAAALPLVTIAATFVFGPYRPTAQKQSPYESGISEIEPPTHRSPIKFYVIAMLFLLFDIEAISFYPWAILLRSLRFPGFIEMFIFIIVLFIGYVYIWKKGALDWE